MMIMIITIIMSFSFAVDETSLQRIIYLNLDIRLFPLTLTFMYLSLIAFCSRRCDAYCCPSNKTLSTWESSVCILLRSNHLSVNAAEYLTNNLNN